MKFNNTIKIPSKNIFQWIGGKKWLKEDIQKSIQKVQHHSTNIYIEPFTGGLGSFKAIAPYLSQTKKIILNDINPVIMQTYKIIQNNPNELIDTLRIIYSQYVSQFNENKIDSYKFVKQEDGSYEKVSGKYHYSDLHKMRDKHELREKYLKAPCDFYMKIRNEFNQEKKFTITPQCAAKFIFLMDTTFNAVYRENSKGNFNTGFSWKNSYSDVELKVKTIYEHHIFFKQFDITFESMDVFDLLNKYAIQDAFVYLDPPYVNNKAGSENNYEKNGFDTSKQIKLLNYASRYNIVLYSNHFHEVIIEQIAKHHFQHIKKVRRNNIMSCKKENRSEKKVEVLGLRIRDINQSNTLNYSNHIKGAINA